MSDQYEPPREPFGLAGAVVVFGLAAHGICFAVGAVWLAIQLVKLIPTETLEHLVLIPLTALAAWAMFRATRGRAR